MKTVGRFLLLLLLLTPLPLRAEPAAEAPRPRLVVVLSVDQLSPAYLDRFRELFRPPRSGEGVGGFRYLMEEGAHHLNAHHDHLHTLTGPGHAALLTGAYPYKHGIIANSWYDRERETGRYSTDDPASPQVGAADSSRGVSPRTLLVSTLGDELKMASGGKAKVWSISYKDRAAVFMGGHLADGALWFDRDAGAWVTSRFYARDGNLPGFIQAWNARRLPHQLFGAMWKLSVPEEALDLLWSPGAGPGADAVGLGLSFPHPLDGGRSVEGSDASGARENPGRDFFTAFITSPHGNAHLLATAREIVSTQEMGRDGVPDLLAVGLSTNDYTGHIFGPHSAEVMDVTVRADAQLSDFFRFLDSHVEGGLERVTIALTSDHGVAPVIAGAMEAGMPGGHYDTGAVSEAVEAALDRRFGQGDWVEAFEAGYIYIRRETVLARRTGRELVEREAARAAMARGGIYVAWTRSAIEEGRVPGNDLGLRVIRSFHPARSGDVLIIEEPYWVEERSRAGATHGSPYGYDTAVPLILAGAGVRPGTYAKRVSTVDLAPTLAAILRVPAPSGSEGAVLGHLISGVE